MTGEQQDLFDGKTYDKRLDKARLNRQQRVVYAAMKDGRYRTLREIAAITDEPEASISARLRDFRKAPCGYMTVDPRRRGDGKRGVWEYKVTGGIVE